MGALTPEEFEIKKKKIMGLYEGFMNKKALQNADTQKYELKKE